TARLGSQITVLTLKKEYQQLKRCLRLSIGFQLDEKDDKVIKHFIEHLSGASTAARPKSVAHAPDAENIRYYMWNCHERVYKHPRCMIQLSFWLHIAAIWGLRTGETTESSSHRGSNESIHYGDITLSLVPWNGNLRYQLKIALRNRKFNRGHEGKVKIITLREHENPAERSKCPIRWFLSLALADEVFADGLELKDFERRWVHSSAGSRVFQIKECKKNTPIFRKL
ncbi:hypothetical protein BU24DRAFT_319010, partial [Aaosphaeria arxii CBS 175.79]